MRALKETPDAKLDDRDRWSGGEHDSLPGTRKLGGRQSPAQGRRDYLHRPEVQGPIMDRLQRSHFLEKLTGKLHLTHYDTVTSSNP